MSDTCRNCGHKRDEHDFVLVCDVEDDEGICPCFLFEEDEGHGEAAD